MLANKHIDRIKEDVKQSNHTLNSGTIATLKIIRLNTKQKVLLYKLIFVTQNETYLVKAAAKELKLIKQRYKGALRTFELIKY